MKFKKISRRQTFGALTGLLVLSYFLNWAYTPFPEESIARPDIEGESPPVTSSNPSPQNPKPETPMDDETFPTIPSMDDFDPDGNELDRAPPHENRIKSLANKTKSLKEKFELSNQDSEVDADTFSFNPEDVDKLIQELQENPADLESLLKDIDTKLFSGNADERELDPFLVTLEEKVEHALEKHQAANASTSQLNQDSSHYQSLPTVARKKPSPIIVEGRIFDAETSEPLANTRIFSIERTAMTDADGYFILPQIYQRNLALTIRRKGYLKKYMAIRVDSDASSHNEDIFLTPQGNLPANTHELVGIGVSLLQTEKGGLVIEQVKPDGPAYKEGLSQGDLIEAIDGKKIKGMSLYDVVNQIRGKRFTEVNVTIRRKSETFTYPIVRDLVRF